MPILLIGRPRSTLRGPWPRSASSPWKLVSSEVRPRIWRVAARCEYGGAVAIGDLHAPLLRAMASIWLATCRVAFGDRWNGAEMSDSGDTVRSVLTVGAGL